MKNFLKYFIYLMLPFVSTLAHAQESVPMADNLRSEGKIYIVVIIILIVLVGLITYLFLLDRKLGRMEKMINEKYKTK
jgi:K+-transporting ATPase A subunit